MTAVTVVATITAQAGKQAEVEAILLALIPPSRAEEGNLQYDLHRASDDDRVFVFVETWASRDVMTRHAQSAHFTAFKSKISGLVEDVNIRVLGKIS